MSEERMFYEVLLDAMPEAEREEVRWLMSSLMSTAMAALDVGGFDHGSQVASSAAYLACFRWIVAELERDPACLRLCDDYSEDELEVVRIGAGELVECHRKRLEGWNQEPAT